MSLHLLSPFEQKRKREYTRSADRTTSYTKSFHFINYLIAKIQDCFNDEAVLDFSKTKDVYDTRTYKVVGLVRQPSYHNYNVHSELYSSVQ